MGLLEATRNAIGWWVEHARARATRVRMGARVGASGLRVYPEGATQEVPNRRSIVLPILAWLTCCMVQGPETKPATVAMRELPRLAKPFLVMAKGEPITTVTGHAAPFVVDYDGDGKRDLVVGMFGTDVEGASGGSARFYRNVGTNKEPKFERYTTLEAEGRPMTMESS